MKKVNGGSVKRNRAPIDVKGKIKATETMLKQLRSKSTLGLLL